MQLVSFRLLFLETCLETSDWSVLFYRFGKGKRFLESAALLSGTMQQSHAVKANSCAAVQEIPCLLWNRMFITVLTTEQQPDVRLWPHTAVHTISPTPLCQPNMSHNRTTARRSSLISHILAHNEPDAPLLTKYVSHRTTAIQNTACRQNNGIQSSRTQSIFQYFVLWRPPGLRVPCGPVSWTPCLCHCSTTFLCVSLSATSVLSSLLQKYLGSFLTPSGLSSTILCAFLSSPSYS